MTDPLAAAPVSKATGTDTPKWGWLLTVWMSLVVAFNGAAWTTGVPDYQLVEAVERGAARVEERSSGEENDDVVRKAIELQRNSLGFWRTLALVGDFLVKPLWLALRAFSIAVALSAVAAMCGRPVRFPLAMHDCVVWQGIWVLRLGVQVVLMFVLQRSTIDTSIVLLLAPRQFTASEWVFFKQLDYFAVLGWLGIAWGACRRGQVHLLAALVTCLLVAVLEASIMMGFSLLINLGMRLSVLPE
jgi:hypothetical protein